jgi:glutamine synthetase
MTEIQGMLTLEELSQKVAAGEIETVVVAFPDMYGRLMGKRNDAEFFLDSVAKDGSHACDYLLTVDMAMEPVQGYEYTNWKKGYGDVHLVPDLGTLRVASWLDRTAMVLCDAVDQKSHERVSVAPRSVLRRQVEAISAAGYRAMAASELEYYVFEDSYRDGAEQGHRDLDPIGWYIEDYHILQGTRGEPVHGAFRRHLRQSGIPVEGSKGEWGRGQHELNIRYADVLTMADRHAVYKQCTKEVADSLGMSITFMAKFAEDQAGSSCHVHLSLWNDGGNVFPGEGTLGDLKCSDVFRWFLGGWIAHVPEVMVFYAPTINSYKRYRAGSWAPTSLAWSHDNRTAGFRVVGSGQGLRVECRIPGADCNPYLSYAAALASGLDGIANHIEPPDMFTGDAYGAENVPQVPQSLSEATDRFARSDFAVQSFGPEVVEHYAHFFRTEDAAWQKAVTDWERARYFEQI